ncbi:MAG: C1 family peptidase, partial [Planctomycetota bacterium]
MVVTENGKRLAQWRWMMKRHVLICSSILLGLSGTLPAWGGSGIGVPTAAMSVGSVLAQTAAPPSQLGMAPVNPEFIAWREKVETFGLQMYDEEGHVLGHIPSPFDWSHLRFQKAAVSEGAEGEAQPPSYDLRTYGHVTPVRNQRACGACWAFATYGSLESWLLKNKAQNWNFSENHLKNYHGFDSAPCEGGNADKSTAYLARWSGPVDESDDPYHDWDDRPSPGGPPRKYVRSVRRFTGADDIKDALMTYGAMYISYYTDSAYYNPDFTYYYNGGEPTNHAVTLIGWDDNKVVSRAPGNGAWLVKNSWGSGWGNSGYFWISYHDTVAVAYAVAFGNAVAPGWYGTIYQYDPLGLIGGLGAGDTTCWAANIFIATADEDLGAVGFHALAEDTSYEIRVFDNFDGSWFSGGLGSTSGTVSNAGYHTIALPSAIHLTNGDDFAIVIRFTTPGYDYPVPTEFPVPDYASGATAGAGQSYISADGINFFDITTLGAAWENANVCIKGLTTRIPTYTISASAGPHGSIQPAGNIVVDHGDDLAFTATPDAGYWVEKWSVDGRTVQGGGNYYILTDIDAAHTVVVTFEVAVDRVLNVDTGLKYPTIQEAIADPLTVDGHEIIADADNTYYETIDFLGKQIDVHSSDVNNPARTIIDGM